MNYKIEITDTALKELKRIDKPTRKKFDKAIKFLRENPFKTHTEKLSGHPEANYRHRIGNWRILFDLLSENIIRIVHVWSRGKNYKR